MTEFANAPLDWVDQNQHLLVRAVARVHALLEARRDDQSPTADPLADDDADQGVEPGRSTLDFVVARFGLTAFERDVLSLCAAMELDSSFAALCASVQGDRQRAYPTFSLALSALPNAHWSALRPDGPLRAWRLITIAPGASLTTSQLRIDERVLHFLTGIDAVDERLLPLIEPVIEVPQLMSSHRELANRIVRAWALASDEGAPPQVQLCGERIDDQRAIAAAACEEARLRLWVFRAGAVPTGAADQDELRCLWQREAAFTGSVLLLDCSAAEADDGRISAALRFADRAGGFVIVATRERRPSANRRTIALDIGRPPSVEQQAAWQDALGSDTIHLDGGVRQLAAQFSLSADSIRAASLEARASVVDGERPLFDAIWDACRAHSRPRLDDLAQRIETPSKWDDLVLPETERHILRDVAAHVRQRARVYDEWGFGKFGSRGLGISALFAGASGTGKTMAAEVLANELRLDLYRIDLSAVVSKYIGETEKNLRRIFDAAEDGGAILLFDEADALFGKRSEVRDSHDRYANIEVSYLLQRMECYRGLAILTTNLKSALDTAFLRRIRFLVQFPFPDAHHRAEIWRRVFPRETPVAALQPERLAQLSVAGGNIRNIAMGAAFLAADADEAVQMTHVLRAARSEYAKMEKVLTEAELMGWVAA